MKRKKTIVRYLSIFVTAFCICCVSAYAPRGIFPAVYANTATPQIEGYDFEDPLFCDDYDDGTIPSDRNWEPSGCASAVTDDAEKGRVLEAYFNKKSVANDTAAMQYPVRIPIRDYLTGDMNYVSFDFKSLGDYNIVISPTKLRHAEGGVDTTVLISKNKWIYPTNGNNPYYYSYLKNVFNVSLSDATKYWNAGKFESSKWCNLLFVIDKTNNMIDVYLDGKLISELSNPNSANVDALYVNTYSEMAEDNTAVFRIDNFKAGKMKAVLPPVITEDAKISALNLSKTTGMLTMTFDADIDRDILLNNFEIYKNSDIAGYNEPTYDSETHTLRMEIVDYDASCNYKVLINGDSDSGYSPCVCELTADGNYVSYLYDDYDDETALYDWKFEKAGDTEYIAEDGRGKILALRLPKKDDRSCAVAKQSGLNEYLGGNMSFISFDMKAKSTQSMVIAPSNDGKDFQASLIAAQNGYYIGTNNVTPLTYDNNLQVFLSANGLSQVQGWGHKGAVAFEGNVWYNIKFVFNKTDKTVTAYVNDKAVYSKQATDKYINGADKLYIGHFSKVEDGEESELFIDNFKAGTFFETSSVSEIVFLDVNGNSHSADSTINSFVNQIRLKFTADVNETTLDGIKVYFEDEEIACESVMYDPKDKCCTVDISKIPRRGDVVKICANDIKTADGLDVDRFEAVYTQGGYNEGAYVMNLGYEKEDGSAFTQKEMTQAYASGTIINATDKVQKVIIVSAEYDNGLMADYKFAVQTVNSMSILEFDRNKNVLKAKNLNNSVMCLTVLNGEILHYPIAEKVIVK